MRCPFFGLCLPRFFFVRSDGRLDHLLRNGARHAVLLGDISTLDVVQPLDRRQASPSLHLNLQTARALLGRKLRRRKLHDFFRIVAADRGHCPPPRAARLLTCLLLLAVAGPAFTARSMALVSNLLVPRSCSSRARASCPQWITPWIVWSLPTN